MNTRDPFGPDAPQSQTVSSRQLGAGAGRSAQYRLHSASLQTRATYAWLAGLAGDGQVRQATIDMLSAATDAAALAATLQRFCWEMHANGASGLLFRRPGALQRVDWLLLASMLRESPPDGTAGAVVHELMPPDLEAVDRGPGRWGFAEPAQGTTAVSRGPAEWDDPPF